MRTFENLESLEAELNKVDGIEVLRGRLQKFVTLVKLSGKMLNNGYYKTTGYINVAVGGDIKKLQVIEYYSAKSDKEKVVVVGIK